MSGATKPRNRRQGFTGVDRAVSLVQAGKSLGRIAPFVWLVLVAGIALVWSLPILADEKPALPQNVAADEIAGVVVDTEGKPLAGVLVDAWTWYEGDETKTDEKGVFRLKTGDPKRRVEIRYSKAGYSPHYVVQQRVGVKAFVVTLGNKTYLEGTVRGPDGRPVAGAEILGLQKNKQADGVFIGDVRTRTTADASGHYRMHVFPDTYELQVAMPGIGAVRVSEIVVKPNEAKTVDIELKPAVRFEARVVDADTHKPAEKVVLWDQWDSRTVGVSDAEGKIVIPDMLPGKFTFSVGFGKPIPSDDGKTRYGHRLLGRWWSADAVNEHERKTIEPKQFQSNFDELTFDLTVGMKPVTIEVERAVLFSGHVYDPDGKPVAGATVAPAHTGTGNSLTGDTRYSVITKEDGSYRVNMPASGGVRYNLVAHDGFYERVAPLGQRRVQTN